MTKQLSTYTSLINTINTTMQKGLLAAQKAVDRERVKTYWAIGRDIYHTVNNSKGALSFGRQLYFQISEDLQSSTGFYVGRDTIKDMVQFYKVYRRCPRQSALTFSHYRALSYVSDQEIRHALEQRAIDENLIVLNLKKEIALMKIELPPSIGRPPKALPCHRGEPYVYKIERMKNIDGEEEYRIDCGFYTSMPFDERIQSPYSSVVEGLEEVRVHKEDGVYRVAAYKKGAEKRFTYLARVLRVVDGDTYDVAIDVGFGVLLKERVRLKRIDTPELATKEGVLAKHFVEALFQKNPWIVIRSSREGVYKRWLADVFIHETARDPYVIATEGFFLNQHLLDQGLAQKY